MTIPDFTPKLSHYVDSTMLIARRSCSQKFFKEFCIGLRPPGLSIDLHAGGCFATALEVVRVVFWTEGQDMAKAMAKGHAAFELAWGDFIIPDYKRTAKTKDRMWEAVEDYFLTYPPITDHVKPFFRPDGRPTTEYTFAIPLEPAVDPKDYYNLREADRNDQKVFPLHPSGDPFLYCGRFDWLGSYVSKPCPVDEKTTGRSISTGWAEQWNLRNQFIGYVWACRQQGMKDVDSVCVRGIAIQKTQFGQAEALKTYSDHLIDKWYEQLRRDLWALRRQWDEQYFDFNLGDACSAYGNCQFMDLCSSPNEQMWYPNYEKRYWNPTLKNPTEAPKDAV